MVFVVEWGSVSDWVTVGLGVITAAASGAAFVFGRRNRRLRSQLEERGHELANALNEVELAKARAETFDALSDQAKQVSYAKTTGPDGETRYVVINNSESPIYDLEIELFAGPTDDDRFTTVAPTIGAKSQYEALYPKPGNPFSCDLRFRDFRGNYWRLDGYRSLTQLVGYQPSLRVVPPGSSARD